MTSLTKTIDPAPLALGAFAANTFLLSFTNAGLINKSAAVAAVATSFAFGGLIQILVGFWELRDGRLFPAVTFGSYGAFWVSFGIYDTFFAGELAPALRGPATALFLAPWIIFTLYMLIGSLRTNIALVIAFLLVEALLIPTVIGFKTGNVTALHIGGWAGIALAAEVWYIAAAEIIAHQFGRTILPLGDLARASQATTTPSLEAAIVTA